MTSTRYKIYRVPSISIQSCANAATILFKVSKYPSGCKWAALSSLYTSTLQMKGKNGF